MPPTEKFIKTTTYTEQRYNATTDVIGDNIMWSIGSNVPDIMFNYRLQADELDNGNTTTDIPYNRGVEAVVNLTSSVCYGYWISLIDDNGYVIKSSCMRSYPTWMNDMYKTIENFHMRDLFIPGTHDSAAYKSDYNAAKNESLVDKYAITQDDDITTQLIHGVRYLDIRVGYYKYLNIEFWANHGVSRQKPLVSILQQVRQFVYETHEIVIIDFQEFPVGFGKGDNVHKKLVALIQREIGDLMIPNIGWHTRLKALWNTEKYIIVSYDNVPIRNLYRDILWQSCQQKWGNVRTLYDLRSYLERVVDELKRFVLCFPK